MVFLLMFRCCIFNSSGDRGIKSLAAAPFGPATFPLLSARAASMSSFSYLCRCCVREPEDFGRGDRKSTRLNSSHTVISYAVFCLKKKKKKFILDCVPAHKLLEKELID